MTKAWHYIVVIAIVSACIWYSNQSNWYSKLVG